MSNEIIDVETTKEVDYVSKVDVIIDSKPDITYKAPEYEVSVNRKHYNVVGDEIYIPKRYEDAPYWMQEIINDLVEVKTSIATGDLDLAIQALKDLADELDVAKNTYTMSIISSNEIDSRINTAIETLNSSIDELDATIVRISQTAVTREEASAISIEILTASLNSENGSIGSAIYDLESAFADLNTATTQKLAYMESSIKADFEANASAMESLNTYVGVENGNPTGTGLLADIKILQKQNDGVIETLSGEWDVIINAQDPDTAQLVTNAKPYLDWKIADGETSIDTRLAHIGDVYIKYSTTQNGSKDYIASYKFIRTTVDTTSPYATDTEGFTWALIVDQGAQDAYEAALNAYDLADNKRRVFVSTPYVPYDIGDLWLVQAGASIIGTRQGGRVIQAGDLLRCTEAKTKTGLYENNDWVPADNYRESMNAIQTDLNNWRTGTYAPFVSNIQTQVDGKAETFYQSSIPLGRVTQVNVSSNSTLDKYVGDLWKNTYVGTVGGYLGNNTEYIYTKTQNGANWNYGWTKMEVPDIVFDTIDTKKSIYSGNSVPVAVYPDIIEINDMWITGSNPVGGYDKESIYVWDGNSWEKPLKYTDDSAAIAIRTGATKITLSQHIDDKNWDNRLTGVEDELANYIDIFTNDISELETQLDGVGVTYFQNERPYLATAGTSINNGDIWFDTNAATNYAERFSYINGVGSWNSITNVNTLNALNVASNTKAAADGVIHTFVQTTEPTLKVGIGDIWFNSSSTAGAKEIYTYLGTGGSHYSGRWNKVGTFVNTTIGLDLSQAMIGTKNIATYVAEEIDKEVVVYSGTTADKTALTGMKVNDIFIEKTTAAGTSGVVVDVVNTYKYSGTAWVQIGNNSNLTALADLADGKRTIFSNDTSMPVNPKVRDMWIPANNYLTYTKGEIYLYNGTSWVVATKYSADIAALTSNVQSQIDSKVDTYYQATIPPTHANATNVARQTTGGDYWYCTNTANGYVQGKMYKYVETPNGSNWNYTWTETADVTKYAFDKADSKAAIYTTAAKPNTYNVRDMLIVINDNDVGTYSAGVVLTATAKRTSGVFTASEWTKQINDTEDLDAFVSNIYEPEINTLKAQVDAKIEYWFQTTDPKSAWTTDEERAKHNGDVWYNTSTKISQYYSSSTNSWNIISDKDALDAITAANAARQLADSKVEVRYGTAAQRDAASNAWTAAEKTSNIGDLWIISDAGDDQYKQFRWTGTGWLDIRDKKIISNASAITQLQADVVSEAGLRASGDTAVTNTVKAYADSVGAGVETKWAYNSSVKIAGTSYNSGFGIATSLTAGSGLTTGQSEFWIKADKFKLMSADGLKKSSYSPFTVDAITGDITFNGKVSFNSINNAPSISSNLLYNSEPSLHGGTKGYVLGHNNTGITTFIGQNVGDWAPSGSSSVYIHAPGTPAPDTVFDIYSEKKIPIVGGKAYCAYAYFGAHRCTAQLIIGFYDANGNIIQYIHGNEISVLNGGKSLSGYGQSIIKVVAPSNAASVLMLYRGKNTTSANPYVFVVRSYLGVIDSVNSETPEWSEGTSVTYTPSNVVSDINTGNTTTINGGRITTGSVTANQINTIGLIAENISANEIVGKTIRGGSISGAIIEGSIIKASYLDLNGQLKVLTDYIISVAMYNSNPSLYTDAVYISEYNNYRIPTLSVVKESNSVFANIYAAGSIYNGSIFSYSTANAGTLLKAQKIRPPVTVLENTDIISSVSYQPWWYNINYHVCNHFRLSLNGITLIEVHVAYQSRAGGPEGNLEYSVTNISGNLISPINITRHRDSDSTYIPLVYNLDLGIKDVILQHTCTTGGGAGYGWNYNFNTEIKITLNSGTRIMPFDWTSGNIKFEQLVDANGYNSFTLKNIQITNLDL